MPLKAYYRRSQCFGICAWPDILFSKGFGLLIIVMDDCDENINYVQGFPSQSLP